jgi:hypothetical protein
MNTFVNTKVLHDTFVQLFVFRASGVIALCRRSHSGGAKKKEQRRSMKTLMVLMSNDQHTKGS